MRARRKDLKREGRPGESAPANGRAERADSTAVSGVRTAARESDHRLLPPHARLLSASAIAPAVAEARGYRSVTDSRELEALGFAPVQRQVPTLLVPIHDVHGQVALYQHRPDRPRTARGKALKYETPKGARLVLDVPPPGR